MKLGKLPAKRSLKSLPLSNYMHVSAVPFPAVKAWERPIDYGMLANDTVGDCTIAAALHLVMNWNAVAHAASVPAFTADEAIRAYSAITGYDPANPDSDQGAYELDVLRYWQSTGISGHNIAGFTTIDPQSTDQVKAAMYLFGGVYIGFRVPAFVVADTSNHHWRVQNDNTRIVGGHAVCQLGYGRAGNTCVSWGALYTMTWDFWMEYVDEAYAIVSGDWIKQSGVSPTGLDLEGLLEDLKNG